MRLVLITFLCQRKFFKCRKSLPERCFHVPEVLQKKSLIKGLLQFCPDNFCVVGHMKGGSQVGIIVTHSVYFKLRGEHYISLILGVQNFLNFSIFPFQNHKISPNMMENELFYQIWGKRPLKAPRI